MSEEDRQDSIRFMRGLLIALAIALPVWIYAVWSWLG